MMEFSTLMEIAHHIEDLFFYIRENGLDSLSHDHKSDLFNLMFQSTDALRDEVEKLENNEPLSSNIDNIITDINSFLEKISNSEKVQKDSAPAPSSSTSAEETSGLPDTTAPFILKIHFDHGCGMENLRAFMIVSGLSGLILLSKFFPADVETNPATADSIVESGFFVALSSQNDVNTAISLLKEQPSIETYEVIEKKAETASETVSGAKAKRALTRTVLQSRHPIHQQVLPAKLVPLPQPLVMPIPIRSRA